MKHKLFAIVIAPLLLLFVSVGCPTTNTDIAGGLVQWPSKDTAINCTSDAIRRAAEASLEDVVGILAWEDLTDPAHWSGPAKESFINIARRLGTHGIEGVMCMIGWRSQVLTAAHRANPDDARAAIMDARAEKALTDPDMFGGYELILEEAE